MPKNESIETSFYNTLEQMEFLWRCALETGDDEYVIKAIRAKEELIRLFQEQNK